MAGASCDSGPAAPTTTEAPTTTAVSTTQGTPTTSSSTTVAPPEKPWGGDVTVGVDQEPPTLNWFLPGGNNFVTSMIGQTYWVGVWDIDGYTLEFSPDVVTELPSVANGGIVVNPDGSETITYTIRDDAVWADGVPISGDDFRFTYDTIMNPDYPIYRAVYEDIIPESVVVGPKTFQFTLTALTLQAEFLFGIVLPKHDVEGKDFMAAYNDTTWMSGGPFEFEQWTKGERLSVTRNPYYWKTDPETGQQLPYLDRVIFQFVPDTDSLVAAFKAREVDVMRPPATIAAIEDLQTLEPQGARVEVLPGPVWEHVLFEFGDGRLTRNPGSYNSHLNYRRAVAHAIDRQKIVDEILNGLSEPMQSFVTPFAPALSQEAWGRYDYDPDKARQYLADLCSEDGVDCAANPPTAVFTTTAGNPDRVRVSELLEAMFTAVGIGYSVELEENSVFFGETLDYGSLDLGEFGFYSSGPGFSDLVALLDWWDPDQPPPLTNPSRWGTPATSGNAIEALNQGASSVIDEHTARFAELRDEMNSTIDVSVLIADLREAENILADQVVFIPLFRRPEAGAVWADTIAGYRHNPSQASDTWNIEYWYRVDLLG